jgi:hypothetical protein
MLPTLQTGIMTRFSPYRGISRISFGILAAFCFSAFSFFYMAAHLASQATTGRVVPFHSFELRGLLRGLDIDPRLDRFPHDFQIEFLGSIVPRSVFCCNILLALSAYTPADWPTVSNLPSHGFKKMRTTGAASLPSAS